MLSLFTTTACRSISAVDCDGDRCHAASLSTKGSSSLFIDRDVLHSLDADMPFLTARAAGLSHYLLSRAAHERWPVANSLLGGHLDLTCFKWISGRVAPSEDRYTYDKILIFLWMFSSCHAIYTIIYIYSSNKDADTTSMSSTFRWASDDVYGRYSRWQLNTSNR